MNQISAYFNKPILKVALLFSAATGIAAFLFFLGLYFFGAQPLGNGRILDLGIYVIMIVGACIYYRRKYGNGLLHLWEALTMGYFIAGAAAIINGWLIYLFVTFVDPQIFADYITGGLKVLEEGRKTQTAFLSEKEFQDLYQSVKTSQPSVLISNEISQRLLAMIIPILVISLIMRKQDYGVFQNKP
jgi:hypothetical protein